MDTNIKFVQRLQILQGRRRIYHHSWVSYCNPVEIWAPQNNHQKCKMAGTRSVQKTIFFWQQKVVNTSLYFAPFFEKWFSVEGSGELARKGCKKSGFMRCLWGWGGSFKGQEDHHWICSKLSKAQHSDLADCTISCLKDTSNCLQNNLILIKDDLLICSCRAPYFSGFLLRLSDFSLVGNITDHGRT